MRRIPKSGGKIIQVLGCGYMESRHVTATQLFTSECACYVYFLLRANFVKKLRAKTRKFYLCQTPPCPLKHSQMCCCRPLNLYSCEADTLFSAGCWGSAGHIATSRTSVTFSLAVGRGMTFSLPCSSCCCLHVSR